VPFTPARQPADYYCNPGLYYDGTECVEQKSLYQNCTRTNECQNDAVCDYNLAGNQVCQKIYSKKIYSNKTDDQIYDCPSSRVSNLCEEGYCTKSGDTSTCTAADRHLDYTKKCSDDVDCKGEYYLEYRSRCLCGLSGEKYCTLYAGDQPRLQTLKLLKEWFYEYSQNCNTGRRNKDDCQADFWGDDYIEYNYYVAYVSSFPYVYNAPDCAVEVFRRDYYIARNDYEDIDDNDNDNDNDSDDSAFLIYPIWASLVLILSH